MEGKEKKKLYILDLKTGKTRVYKRKTPKRKKPKPETTDER